MQYSSGNNDVSRILKLNEVGMAALRLSDLIKAEKVLKACE